MACTMNVTTPRGFSMPALGFGTWNAKDAELETALEAALESGYRHIDTAFAYENEQAIGKVLKRWFDAGKLTREDLFIVTKLPVYGNRPSEVEIYLNKSLENLGLSYVDLYLVHTPFTCIKNGNDLTKWELDHSTDLLAIWKEMEKQVDEGRAKAIGISNFNNKQLERILQAARIPPATNQVEMHLYLQQPELVEFHTKNGVSITAYSPLGTLGFQKIMDEKITPIEVQRLMDNPVVLSMSTKYNKTPAQILLRHLLQKGVAAIPKSSNPERIKENINVFDFEITVGDMDKLNTCNINHRILDFGKVFKGCDKHPEYPF